MTAISRDCNSTCKVAVYLRDSLRDSRLQENWLEHVDCHPLQTPKQVFDPRSHQENQVRTEKKHIHQALKTLLEGAKGPKNKALTNSIKVRK